MFGRRHGYCSEWFWSARPTLKQGKCWDLQIRNLGNSAKADFSYNKKSFCLLITIRYIVLWCQLCFSSCFSSLLSKLKWIVSPRSSTCPRLNSSLMAGRCNRVLATIKTDRAWSRWGRSLYRLTIGRITRIFTYSPRKVICAYVYDEETGWVAKCRAWLNPSEETSTPDKLLDDQDGCPQERA